MKTPTPETDEVICRYTKIYGMIGQYVEADFARKLERERDEARAKLKWRMHWVETLRRVGRKPRLIAQCKCPRAIREHGQDGCTEPDYIMHRGCPECGIPWSKFLPHNAKAMASAGEKTTPKQTMPTEHIREAAIAMREKKIREAANDLHAAFFVMRHDWKDGDFDLPPLARIHMESMECKAIELGKLLFRRQNADVEARDQ